MDYVVLFKDDEEHVSKRGEFMAAHLDFLDTHSEQISDAGPLNNRKTNEPAGGIWLVSADTVDEVLYLVQKDPFWPTGLRKDVEILEWNKVFRDGARVNKK
ncbi:MAG: YciI family protein [Sneathiella sp.]